MKRIKLFAAATVAAFTVAFTPGIANAATKDLTVHIGNWNCPAGGSVTNVMGTIAQSDDRQTGWQSGNTFVVESAMLLAGTLYPSM